MSFWYLATPYRAYPGGLDLAHDEASAATAGLLDQGIEVYSPIAHSHYIAHYVMRAGPRSDFWLQRQVPFLHAAKGLLILHMPGWDRSGGIEFEGRLMHELGKPIFHLGWPDTDLSVLRLELAA